MELSWRSLVRLWESKLKWAFILAEKSNISLNVTDLTVATEFGGLVSPTLLEGVDERPATANNMAMDRREDAFIAQSAVYLHIDVYKVDQVIRNLITNAVECM